MTICVNGIYGGKYFYCPDCHKLVKNYLDYCDACNCNLKSHPAHKDSTEDFANFISVLTPIVPQPGFLNWNNFNVNEDFSSNDEDEDTESDDEFPPLIQLPEVGSLNLVPFSTDADGEKSDEENTNHTFTSLLMDDPPIPSDSEDDEVEEFESYFKQFEQHSDSDSDDSDEEGLALNPSGSTIS